MKIEEGFCRGNVVFHALVDKSKADIKKNMDTLKSKRELKEKRKKIQEANVAKKEEATMKKDGVETRSKTPAKKSEYEEDGVVRASAVF
jgi:hypothetical protein